MFGSGMNRQKDESGQDKLRVDPKILEMPEKLSPLGRQLLDIAEEIRRSGARARSLQEIHRELAMDCEA
jgi:hypothetical protein